MDVLVTKALDARYGLDCDCASINKMFKEAIKEQPKDLPHDAPIDQEPVSTVL